jgi:hypothetical protein
MQTTLNKIKENSPCEGGWEKLLNYLNKTEADDEPLELRTILQSNGIQDTIWAFRAVEGKDKEIRLFAADCAELVLPIYENAYPDDNRPRLAILAARDYVNGLITLEELSAAYAAAYAAWAACDACAASVAAAEAAARAADASWAADVACAAIGARDEITQLLLKYI